MRRLMRFRTTMAASIAVRRLTVRGRKCLFSAEVLFCTRSGARAEETQRERTEQNNGPKAFCILQAERQAEAERSVLISCHPKTHENKFLKYLSRHGNINKCFFYESFGVYAVVEFAEQDGVRSLLQSAAIPSISHESVVPLRSRLLAIQNVSTVDSNKMAPQSQPQRTVPINELIEQLSSSSSIEQQIVSLTEAYQLTDENSRLRFLVCSLLKDIAAAYFPKCTIKPFGSSVNGFGKLGCDLDMFLDLDDRSERNTNVPRSGMYMEYQMKRSNSERAVTQSILSVIAESLEQFGPGCVGVQKILNARCPLVRFAHQPSGFQCDLTANNRVAMRMSELLYLFGELDTRVRPLVFTVRCWARAHSLTSSIPGAWITNFSLTVMVLFFLQKRSPPILPTLDQLQELAGPSEQCVIDGINCTFTSDFHKIQLQTNTESLEQLLCDFFEFYSSFPFNRMSINIRKGTEEHKPELAPLHIQNPFQTSLNVSKNVNSTQLERLVTLCQESAWLLQQKGTVATLLLPSQVTGVKGRKKRKREPASERIKGLLESLRTKNDSQKS